MTRFRRLLRRGPASSPAALMPRVRTAFRLSGAEWDALVADIGRAARGWTERDWLALPVRDRVALFAARDGRRVDVERLAEARTVHGGSFLVDRDSLAVDLGSGVAVPDWLLAAQPHDLVARVDVEAAGSDPVVVAGLSFIAGVTFDPSVDRIRATAGLGAITMPVDVAMRPDPAAAADSGERWADQSAAAWWARVDADRSEPITLTVTVESAGFTRATEVLLPALTGPVAGVGVRQAAEGLVLQSPADLRVASSTLDWAAGPSPVALPARLSRFGRDSAVPTGRWSLTTDRGLDLADPDQLTRPLAEREIDLGETLVTLRGWSPGQSGPSLVVRNPMPVEHRGRHGQRLLLQQVREQAGPLRERAVAMCFGGRGSGDSVAPIAVELMRRGIAVDWCVADASIAVPDGATPVLLHSRAWHEAFAHARYLINNAEFPHYSRFREGQRYLQTWHGTPLKRIGRDIARPRLSAGYSAAMTREAVAWEALLAQNDFAAGVLPGAFGFAGRTLVEGYPRNDALIADPTLRARTRAQLGLGDEPVVLYAPTWRDTARDAAGRRAFVAHLDAGRVHERTGAPVLVRGHVNAAAARGRVDQPGVIDVTDHPDVTALLAAADTLITDYSSLMFDFAVTERPQILLAPDASEYHDQRGLYLDLDADGPGPVVTSTDEAIDCLLADPWPQQRRTQFRQRFAPLDDGGAARRVVDAWLGPASGVDQPQQI